MTISACYVLTAALNRTRVGIIVGRIDRLMGKNQVMYGLVLIGPMVGPEGAMTRPAATEQPVMDGRRRQREGEYLIEIIRSVCINGAFLRSCFAMTLGCCHGNIYIAIRCFLDHGIICRLYLALEGVQECDKCHLTC